MVMDVEVHGNIISREKEKLSFWTGTVSSGVSFSVEVFRFIKIATFYLLKKN